MSIIIPNGTGGGAGNGGIDYGHSHIGWRNKLDLETVSSLVDPDNLGFLYDNMTSLFWNAGAGTVDVDITFLTSTFINWVGVANGNWLSAGTTIEIYIGNDTNKVAELSGLSDGDPMMWVFDDLETTFVRIRFISDGELKVGEAGTGQSIKFPCLPNTGLKLGKFNNNDKVFAKRTEDDLLAASSTIKRSRTTAASYEFVSIDWVRLFWVTFSNQHKGRLVWFLWDSLDRPYDVSFGHWDANEVGYTKSTFARIDFAVIGDAR